jgi:hypothetical protein
MALDCKVAQRFPGNRKLSKKPSKLSDHSLDDEKELCMNRMYLDVPCMWMVFGYFLEGQYGSGSPLGYKLSVFSFA